MPLKTDLSYTCPNSGVTFRLRPIPPLNFEDFNIAYDQGNPPPNPPLVPVKVADKVVTQADYKDEYFLILFTRWSAKKEQTARHFMFYMGVEDNPPDSYAPDPFLYFGELTPGMRKGLWVSDQLKTVDDTKGLVEAIKSLMSITEEGLEDEKKDTALEPVGLTSSNGNLNQTPTLSNSSIP